VATGFLIIIVRDMDKGYKYSVIAMDHFFNMVYVSCQSQHEVC